MTAYRNNFVVISDIVGGASGQGNGPSNVNNRYEPVLVAHDLLTTNNGDVIMAEVDYAA